MPRTALTHSLKQLHEQLEAHPTLQADERALLQTVLTDIQHTLDGAAHTDEPLTERLEGAALSFEARHPELATLATELAALLRRAGI